MLIVACDRCQSTKEITRLENEDICEACKQGDNFEFLVNFNPHEEEKWNELLDDRRCLYDELCGE